MMKVSKATAKRFLEGDEAAFSEIYRAYRPLLYFIISTYVSRKEDCDDVYQDVFTKIWEKKGECKDPSGLHYYLCSIAKNEAINAAKRLSSQEALPYVEEENSSSSPRELDALLPYELGEDEKKIVGYRLGFGLSWKEISNITGIPLSSAKLKYRDALKTIKKEMEKWER